MIIQDLILHLPIFRQMHQMEHWQTETRLKYIWINLWQTSYAANIGKLPEKWEK